MYVYVYVFEHILDAKVCLASCTQDFQRKLKDFEELNEQNLLLECQVVALKEGTISTTPATELEQSFTTGARTPRLGLSSGENEKVRSKNLNNMCNNRW